MFHIINERKQRRRALIQGLDMEDGRHLTTQQEIGRAFLEHYTQLYTAVDTDMMIVDEVSQVIFGTIGPEAEVQLMEDVTEEEVVEAIGSGAANKSPGPDGLPLEFYRTFRDILTPTWTLICRELMSPDVPLPPAFVEGLIIPIRKPSGRTRIRDYRPLTLLNCDFKIFSRLLAARLRRVLRQVISLDQTSLGGVANIQTALGEYRDVIALAKACRLRGALASIDFDQAFDRVSHTYLAEVLKHMRFPQPFITIVMRLLCSASSKVLVNGRTTASLSISRSVRQGCPLSTILYALALEPLLCGLRQRLTGLTMRGYTFKCKAYADDLVLMIRNENDMRVALDWINTYGMASGSRINVNKSMAMNIGLGVTEDYVAPLQLKETMKCLGIVFTQDVRHTAAYNYKRLLQSIRTGVRGNTIRALDMIQRVKYVNTYMASRIPHLAQILPMPKMIARRILAAFGSFVSAGLLFKVRYETLTLPLGRGGLGLTHVQDRGVALYISTMLKMWERHQTSLTGILIEELAPTSRIVPETVQHISQPLHHIRAFFLEYSNVLQELPETRPATSRDIYRILTSRRPNNLIENKYPNVNWPVVWRSIHNVSMDTETRAMWYLLTVNMRPDLDFTQYI